MRQTLAFHPTLFLIVLYILSYNRLVGGVGAAWLACPLLIPYWLNAVDCGPRWVQYKHIWPGVGLVMACVQAAVLSADPIRVLGQGGKFALSFLLIYPILLSRRSYASTALQACIAAVIVNAALIVFGIAGVPGVLIDSADGRWGTILTNPGGLARLGAGTYGYALLTLASPSIPLRGLALLFCVALLVLYDGSRGVFLAMVTLTLLISWFISIEFRHDARQRRRFMAGLVFAGVALFIIVPYLVESEVLKLNPRVIALADFSDDAMTDRLRRQDSLRYDQYAFAAARIVENPFFGSGLTFYAFGGVSQTLHNSYLQAWVGLGLLGLVSFMALTLWWIRRTTRIISGIALLPRNERPLCYNALCCLVVYAVMNLFGPIPIELPDWIMFLAASALCAHVDTDVAMRIQPKVRSLFWSGRGLK